MRTEVGVGAYRNRSLVLSSGGRRSSIHGCSSVHTVVELRKDVRDLHHLTGHYHQMRGDDDGDTALLKGMDEKAAAYLQGFHVCH